MAAVRILVVALALAASAIGVAHLPPVRRYVLRQAQAYLADNQGLELGADRLDYNLLALKVSLHELSLRRADAPAEHPAFFAADRLAVNLAGAALLRGAVDIEEILLEGARIELVIDAEGGSNLPAFGGGDEPDAGNGGVPDTLIRRLRASGPLLRYADAAAGLTVEAPDWSLEIDGERQPRLHAIAFRTAAEGRLALGGRSLPLQPVSVEIGLGDDEARLRAARLELGGTALTASGDVAGFAAPRLSLRAELTADAAELSEFAALETPVAGRLALEAELAGPLDGLAVTARATGEGLGYGQFRDAALAASLAWSTAERRVRVDELSLAGPFGAVEGAANVFVGHGGERGSLTLRLERLDLAPVSRQFELPLVLAARASGAVEASWPGFDFEQAEAEATLRLTPARSAAARDVLPLAGSLRARVEPGRIRADLRGVEALGARLDGAVRIDGLERLDGQLQIAVAALDETIAEADRYLGASEGESAVPMPVAGSLTASAALGGTLEAPSAAVVVQSDDLAVGGVAPLALRFVADASAREVGIERLNVSWNGQAIEASGRVGLAGDSPELALEASADSLALPSMLDLADLDLPIEGALGFDIRVGGAVAAPRAEAVVTVRGLDAYGEPWGDLDLRAEYAGSRAELTELRLTKPQTGGDGRLTASGAYDFETGDYEIDLASDGLRLESLVLPGGKTPRGGVELSARGTGSVAAPALEAGLAVRAFSLDGLLVGDASLDTDIAEGAADILARVERLALEARAKVGLEAPHPASFRAEIRSLDLAPLEIEPRAGAKLEGAVTAAVEGAGEIDNWREGSLLAEISEIVAKSSGVTIRNDGPWRFAVRNGRLAVEQFALVSGRSRIQASGELPFDAGAAAGELRIEGAVNLDATPTLLGKTVEELFVLGILNVDGFVRGSLAAPEPDVTLRLEDGVVFAPATIYPVTAIQIEAGVDAKRVELRRLTAEYARGKIAASGSAPFAVLLGDEPADDADQDLAASFRFSIDGLDLETLDVIPDGGGAVSLALDARASKPTLEALTATLEIPELSLRVRDLRLDQVEPARMAIAGGQLGVEAFHLSGPRTDIRLGGTVGLAGERPLDLRVDLVADAAVASYLLDDPRFSGPVEAHVAVGGDLDDPALDGSFAVRGGTFSLESPRLDSDRFDLALRFDRERVEIQTLSASVNGGRLVGSGGLGYRSGVRDVDVRLRAEGLFLDFPEGLRTLSTTDVRLRSVEDNLIRLDGEVRIDEGSFREPLDFESQALAFLRSSGALDFAQEPNPLLARLRYNVAIRTAEPISIDNNLARLEARTNLRLVGTYYRPSIVGRVELEEDGEIYLAERRYVVENGVIDFTSEQRIRPALNLSARTQVAGYDIVLRATGDGEDMRTQFAADPPLPEPDVISLLLTGRTLEQAQESGLNIAREQALSYLTGSLGGRVGRAAQESLGLTQVRIEPNLISNEGNPSARLTIGQQLTRQLGLIYSMNLTNSGDQIFVTEYDITRRFQTRGVKQSDNTYRFDFRHDVRWGLADAPRRGGGGRERLEIGEVTFEGDPRRAREDLLKILKMRPGGRYEFFRARKRVDRLLADYRKEGRHEARVRLRRERRDGAVDLHFEIDAGPRIEFAFEPGAPPGSVRAAVVRAWQRGVFQAQRLDDASAALRTWLDSEGYYEADVDAAVEIVDDDRRRASFRLDRGVRYSDVRLVFTGNANVDAATLELVLERTGLRERMRAAPRQVASKLGDYYRQLGYLDAEVERPRYELEPDTGAGRVRIAIREGPRFTIGELSFTGNRAVSEEILRPAVTPPPGRAYTPEYLEEALRKAEDVYWRRGYNDVLINFRLTRRSDRAQVDIEFDIAENRRDVVDEIVVAGNQHVEESLIRSRIVSAVGEPLVSENNDRTRRRLYDIGAFSLVDLETERLETPEAPPDTNLLRLTARVREVSPYRLRYGAFFDTERGFGSIADIESRNVLGSARVLGGRARWDNRFREGRAFFSQPLVRGLPLRTTSATFVSRELRDAFVTDRTGVSAQQEVEFGRRTYILQYGYRFERTHTFDRDPDAFIPLDIRFNLAPLTTTFTHDTRNEILDATRGQFYSLALEYAPSNLGSDIRYVKSFAQYFRYMPFFTPASTPFDDKPPRPRLVWAGGVRAGLASGLGGQTLVPSERFFAGGGTTVRGFAQDRLGPVDFAGQPTGGDAVFLLNQELRFPVVSVFEGVGFLDAGNVYRSWRDFDPSDLRYAAGVGLRVRTPFFLLRLDYGLKLARRPDESRGAFFFSIGQAF